MSSLLSYGVEAVVILILAWIPVLHPEVLEGPKKDYHAIELVPTPVPENHEPQRQLPRPVFEAKVGSTSSGFAFARPSAPTQAQNGGSRRLLK